MASSTRGGHEAWWSSGVLYQIYVRSFADTTGDGVGDLRGVIEHLDYLEWLGVDGLWLSPVTVSPNADFGYDVADYVRVQPEYGTLADLDELIAEARARGLRVLLDLVPNHTSDHHPWFVDARSSAEARYRDWYVWADGTLDGSLPNNWVSSFGGPAWTYSQEAGQYYLHQFLPEQPDLNWWNDAVRRAFDEILCFWFDRGVAGFRIDVCHGIVKDAQLRDNPPCTPDDPFPIQIYGQRPVYTSNRPEVHGVLRHWREIAQRYDPPRVLLGETNVEELDVMASYYGNGTDELNLAFNFPFINAPFEAAALREIVETTERLLPAPAWPVWTGSNHDVSRLATRWAGGDPARTRAALLMLAGLRGTPVLYQGDELGLTDTPLTQADLHDPVGLRFWPLYAGRDPVRTPMPWTPASNGGFSRPGMKPWLPLGNAAACNVEDQRADPFSPLTLVRDLLRLRRDTPDLRIGSYRSLDAPPGVWLWQRGDRTVVAVNLSSSSTDLEGVRGKVLIGTDRQRDGEALTGALHLDPWEGLVLES